MTQEELNKIIENHQHYLKEDCENWKHMRANFEHADLRGLDFENANLESVSFAFANLESANLSFTNLKFADLSRSNLTNADFEGTDLRFADLVCAKLNGINLSGANLYKADLKGVINAPFIPYVCPNFGSFIGYKKANRHIVELQILEDSKRLSATTRKCRCDKAKVLRILNYDGTVANITEVASNRDKNFIYKVGEIVSVDNFEEDRWNECSTGIHFFINFQEAVNYCL